MAFCFWLLWQLFAVRMSRDSPQRLVEPGLALRGEISPFPFAFLTFSASHRDHGSSWLKPYAPSPTPAPTTVRIIISGIDRVSATSLNSTSNEPHTTSW
jgi:hypothetical protein